jgi:GT2 family glycosyltransferase
MSSTVDSPDNRVAKDYQVSVRSRLGVTQRPWAVLDMDIADGVPELPSVDDEGKIIDGAFVLVRVFTEPVAGLWVSVGDAGLSRAELVRVIDVEAGEKVRERLRSAGWLESASGLPLDGFEPTKRPEWLVGRDIVEAGSLELTVALCTRDRLDDVKTCIASLQEQTYPRLTILVIDNAPSDDRLREFVKSTQFKVPVRYVVEPRPGLSYARNKAVDECQTELISFIDDDEVACPYWVSEVVRGFADDPTVDCVGGVVVPSELRTPAEQLFERYGGHSKGRGFQSVTFDGERMGKVSPLFPLPPFGVGANMSFRVGVIRDLGGFDTALGAGTSTRGGEDTKMLSEVLLSGRRIAYRPTAVTHHCHRATYEELRLQLHGAGIGLTAYYTSMVMRHPTYAFRLLALAPRGIREIFGSHGDRTNGLGKDFLPTDLIAAHRKGVVRGPLEYLKTRIRQSRQR